MEQLSVSNIESALADYSPRILAKNSENVASVALILLQSAGSFEILMIERAIKPEDPWSGQIAFPGGRLETTDKDERAAAERETREEVGVDLCHAHCLGRLDDISGSRASKREDLAIACFVYLIPDRPELTPNYEVGDTLWVPFRQLVDKNAHIPFTWANSPERNFNGIKLDKRGDRVLWGLTYRFVESFFSLIGYRLPPAEIL